MCGDKYLKSQVSSSFSFFEPGLQLTSEIYKAEMEGPTVAKWDNVYYLFYSANHFKRKITEWATQLQAVRWGRGRNTRETRFCNVPTV